MVMCRELSRNLNIMHAEHTETCLPRVSQLSHLLFWRQASGPLLLLEPTLHCLQAEGNLTDLILWQCQAQVLLKACSSWNHKRRLQNRQRQQPQSIGHCSAAVQLLGKYFWGHPAGESLCTMTDAAWVMAIKGRTHKWHVALPPQC